MKIFNKNNLVLAIACLLAIASVASADYSCGSDDECEAKFNDCYKCECDPDRRLEEEKPRALRMVNEQAAAARNAKRGFESGQTRRAKSKAKNVKICKVKKGKPFAATCVFKSGKSCPVSEAPSSQPSDKPTTTVVPF